jgi:hypothetical protein
MRGHEHIKTMRRQGATPRLIYVDCDPCTLQCWRTWHQETPHNAQVEIEPGDFIAGLDLRYAVGVKVLVNGSDNERVKAVGRAFERVGAARVVTATTVRTTRYLFDVTHFTDWPAAHE